MSDQCKYCQVYGDYEKCIVTPCFHHENWINKQRIVKIQRLEEKLNDFVTLYHVVNKMMMRLGADGEINTLTAESCDVMNALADIDGGEYNAKYSG